MFSFHQRKAAGILGFLLALALLLSLMLGSSLAVEFDAVPADETDGSGTDGVYEIDNDTEVRYPENTTIRVTMRLIGAELAKQDVDLGAEAYMPDYVTWIPTSAYVLDEGATVYDLWVLATEEYGIRSIGAARNYVETVYAPEGYELSEFTNGRRSGWMYTIDGRHPGYGLKEQALHDGDEVIWHYINDYSYECADWFNEGQWQALGDGTYYNQWLKAPDTYLGTGGGVGGSSGESDKKTIRVTMRLIGAELATKDVDLGAEAYLPDYVTWIPTTSYELDEGAKVYDLWVLATQQAGIRSVGAERDYVETVYAPGGYELSEFTNGNRSGWMYTVNGTHPGRGLTNWTLNDGDVVIWHYINDYSYECADWFNDGQWQALGDGTYYNQWLKAPDTYLGAGGGIGVSGSGSDSGSGSGSSDTGSGSSGSETTETEPKAEETTVTVNPEVTDGEAKAEVGTEAIAEALKNNGDAQVLTVKVETEDAESVEAALTADTVKAAAEAEVDLHIETENGTIKIDAETLKEAAESGKEVSVTVRTNEDGTTTFDVTAGGEAVNTAMKVELPAAEEGQVLVIVSEDGTEEIIKKSVVEGDTVYAEIPAGATVKVIENSKEFNDVADNAWYAGAVDFASSHDLFRGVSEDEFAPQSPMTRTMLATVLFRLEDEPEGAAGVNFGDVKDDTWYADAVAWASENGIVNGTGSGFDPNANISREQIATMLYRYVNYLGIDTGARGDVSKFKDGKEVSSWASDAMAWAVEVGLFKGDETGSLNPKADATRAEVATLMERLIGLLVK